MVKLLRTVNFYGGEVILLMALAYCFTIDFPEKYVVMSVLTGILVYKFF